MDAFQLLEWKGIEIAEDAEIPVPRIVIAGLPRGGTAYIADVLRRLGAKRVGHEALFRMQGLSETPIAPTVEVSGLVAPWLRYLRRRGTKIYHLIRDPVENCRSLVQYFAPWMTWERACLLYLQWHQHIASWAGLPGVAAIHLERMAAEGDWTISRILWEADEVLMSVGGYRRALLEAWRNPGKNPGPPRVWDDLPHELQVLGREHGYGPRDAIKDAPKEEAASGS